MTDANLNQLWARVLVESLVQGGVRHAVVCPGSRSSPLALACAQQLSTWTVIDERSAAFFALGLAKESGAAVALVATSGTAGAHFYPAVIEAFHGRVPLIAMTADRPPELHGFGAQQTIVQQELFGRFTRGFIDLGVPDSQSLLHLRHLGSRAVFLAQGFPRGPVHLNAPFREPLAPVKDETFHPGQLGHSGPILQVAKARRMPNFEVLAKLKTKMSSVRRGVIVCGPREVFDGLPAAAIRLGKAFGYPVLSEALSQARFGHASRVISLYETLLRHAPFAQAHVPELILHLGGGLTTRTLQNWVDGSGAEIVLLEEQGQVFDPSHTSSLVVEGDAVAACEFLAEGESPRSPGWLKGFESAEHRARAAFEAAFAEEPSLTEPAVARELARALPPGANLFVSSSMPVRDLDAFADSGMDIRVFANRGANGIDGIVSSALGVSASSKRPTVSLLGDLAALHDLGGWAFAAKHKIPLTAVVINNDGGGIFSFLPIAQFPEHFETLFGTPQGLSFEKLAALFGASHACVRSGAELRNRLNKSMEGGLHIIEVPTERRKNVEDHRRLFERVGQTLGNGPWA